MRLPGANSLLCAGSDSNPVADMQNRTRSVAATGVREPRRAQVPVDRSVPPDRRSEVKQVVVPPPPTATEPLLWVEQQVTRVEDLMVKGVRTPAEIIRLLKLDPSERPKVVRWMRMARARWEVMVGDVDMNAARIETLAKLAQQERALWSMLGQTRRRWIKKTITVTGADGKPKQQVVSEAVDEPLPPLERLAVHGKIRDVVMDQAAMNGLNKDTIPLLMSDEQVPQSVRRNLDRQSQIMDVLHIMAGALRTQRERAVAGTVVPAETGDSELEDDSDESDEGTGLLAGSH